MDGLAKLVGSAVLGVVAIGAIAAGAIDLTVIANILFSSGQAAYEAGAAQVEAAKTVKTLPGRPTLGPAQ